ncbi:hypothetical protein SAMN02745716_1454 [Thermoleophilum album]|uniref:Leucine-binding protein domain-containing protein n=2 Tax=Thermoleophilum album TaxID=29539 RepID=A0A1H6FUC4_THEAL|nr:hypothetical protein SAMN02745716_1454 [Thermoleophilum album]
MLVVLLALLTMSLLGCGGDEVGVGAGRPLLVVVSAPSNGPQANLGEAFAEGFLAGFDGRVRRFGKLTVRVVRTDPAALDGAGSDPSRIATAADAYARDPRLLAYVGELDAQATAVSLPRLAARGIPVVVGAPGAVGLSGRGPGQLIGEPARYYPTGIRTLVRLVSDDRARVRLVAAAFRRRGCKTPTVVSDGTLDGDAALRAFRFEARRAGLAAPYEWRYIGGRADLGVADALAAAPRPLCVLLATAGGARGLTLMFATLAAARQAVVATFDRFDGRAVAAAARASSRLLIVTWARRPAETAYRELGRRAGRLLAGALSTLGARAQRSGRLLRVLRARATGELLTPRLVPAEALGIRVDPRPDAKQPGRRG